MAYRSLFSSQEWQTLMFAPLWVFNAVAAIDGKVDDKEAEALAKEVADGPIFKNDLVREVLSSLGGDFNNSFSAYRADSRSVLDGLRDVADLLDRKVTTDAALAFKKVMIGIGVQVAKASGGILGSKMSDNEQKALVLVAVTLRISPEDLAG